jgi:hypothetical protein
VLNAAMLRLAVTTLLLAVCLAAPATAATVEIGRTDATPACPASPCLAVSRTTGYQAKVGDKRGDFVVPADGKIVAWSIALGTPTAAQIAFFDKNLGGVAKARLTVLRPGKRLYSRVVTQSPLQRLSRYFGQTVQFPLGTALNVKQGYVIALSVPTWAPALTQLIDDGSSWRASRPLDGCDQTNAQTAQGHLKQLGRYRCLYKARLTYSATLVTRPTPTADLPPAG